MSFDWYMRDKVNSETAFWHSLQDLSASRENDMIEQPELSFKA
jgi:hypothetical protein